MLKALLVDMEGALVHSTAAHAAAYAEALRDCGSMSQPVTRAPGAGMGSWCVPKLPFAPVPMAITPVEVARRQLALTPSFVHLYQPNQRVVDLVRLLHGPLATALVTTASHAMTEAVLTRLGLVDLFDILITGDHVLQPKPAPEGFAMAALLLRVQPEECLVIESSEVGMTAARAFCGGLLRWSDPPARSRTAGGAETAAAAWGGSGTVRH